jgi:hypothetical protein
MELGSSTGLWWGLLAVPILGLYLLKTRRRRVPVSTVLFWNRVFEDSRPRSLWRRMRHWVSLLVQLALLALLVLALTDPRFAWERLQARRIVLVVDNSASMNATDVAPTRLERAKELGRRWIRRMRGQDEMAILSAGCTARVEVGMTSHPRTLERVLDAIAATDGPTQVLPAVDLARRVLGDHKNAEIYVLSDACFPACAEIDRARDVRLCTVGKPVGNVAITAFQVRRSLVDPVGYCVLAEVTNFSEEAVACRLEIQRNGNLLDVIPLKLAPDQRWSKVIEQATAEESRLVARLDRADALPADNEAAALLPARKPQPVLLVTEGNVFLERVFEAIPAVALQTAEELPSRLPDNALIVLDRKVPATLPPGNLLILNPAGPTDAWQLGEPLSNPAVTSQDSQSPLMAHVRLENVLMPEARRLAFNEKPTVLMKSLDGDSLYCALERPTGKVLVLAVDLAKSDLPLRTAFPIMMTNAVGWFHRGRGELREAVRSGDTLEVDLAALGKPGVRNGCHWRAARVSPATGETGVPLLACPAVRKTRLDEPTVAPSVSSGTGETPVAPAPQSPRESFVLRSPDGKTRPLPPVAARTTIGPLDQCGVWSIVRSSGEASPPVLEMACNLANPAESDLRRPHATTSRSEASAAFGTQPIWFYLVAMAFVLAVAEWYLCQRRWID